MKPLRGKGITLVLPPFLGSRLHNFRYNYLEPHGLVLTAVHGNKMYADARDTQTGLIFIKGLPYEEYETELFKASVKKGMTVVDVGAHVGYYTLLAAGQAGSVFAFEPEPYNFALLKRNVEVNNYKNVTLEQKAVLNRSGAISLFLCEFNLGAHRIFELNDRRKSIMVQGVTLDEYFRDKTDKIDIIKMDIEGAEATAFAGMTNILNTNEDLKIFLEFWITGQKALGYSPRMFLNTIFERFKVYLIDEKRKKIVQQKSPDNMLALGLNAMNLLLRPEGDIS